MQVVSKRQQQPKQQQPNQQQQQLSRLKRDRGRRRKISALPGFTATLATLLCLASQVAGIEATIFSDLSGPADLDVPNLQQANGLQQPRASIATGKWSSELVQKCLGVALSELMEPRCAWQGAERERVAIFYTSLVISLRASGTGVL